MEINTVTVIISLFFTITGGVIGILVYKRTITQDKTEKIKHDTKIDVKLDNIATNVNEIRLENKDFSKSINALGERVTAVEQSTKQAHKRINSLEELHLTK